MRILIALLLFGSAFCFALGISLPIAHFQKLYFFNERPSLIDIFVGLWADGSFLIALAVLLFSIIFPATKLAVVFISAVAPQTQIAHSPLTKFTGVLSKWSMMDVLLVALFIFAAKTSGLANAFAQTGLWFYAGSAIAGAIAAGLLKRSKAQDQAAVSIDQEGRREPV